MTARKPREKAELMAADSRWLHAMNSAADMFQKAASSEKQVFDIFQKQVSELGLRGGIAVLVDGGKKLQFKSIAQGRLSSVLTRLEKLLNLRARDFSVLVDSVDVYREVIRDGEMVYVSNTAEIISQMLTLSERSLVSKVMEAFGSDPAIYVPLTVQDKAIGLLNVAGPALSPDDLPAMKAFASYISAALANARLFQELKEQEFSYRSLFDNLPLGIFRVSPEGNYLMANPFFLQQFQVESFDQLAGKTLSLTGLRPLHDRNEVTRRLVEQGRIIGFESEWESKSGERIYFKENITAAYGPEGEVLYYEGSVENITERKRTEQILKKQLDDLMILNRIAATGAGASTLDDLIARVTEIIGEQLFPDHFGMLLWDQEEGVLKIHPSYFGIPAELVDSRIKPGEGVVGKVFASGQPILIADTSLYPEYIVPGKRMGSELCVPIRSGEKVVGVLNAERETKNGFSPEDEILLLTIADQLATALDRVTFFDAVERQALQLTLLNEAILTTSRVLDPNELIRLIATQIMELFKPDSFVVTLYDEDRSELEIAIAVSQGEIDDNTTGMILPLEMGGLTTLVVETGEVLHVDDLEKSPLIVGIEDFQNQMVGSWVGVPLISGQKVIGALAVQYFDKMLIDQEQTQFLVSMASHAAIAITNGRLFDDIQNRFELSSHLASIGESLNRTQSLKEVLETIGNSAVDLMGSIGGVIFQVADDGKLECVWHHGLEKEYVCSIADHLAADLTENPLPIIFPDVRKLDPGNTLIELSKAQKVGAISLWPLVYEGLTIAVVGCFKPRPYRWREEEQDAMMTFSRQAAVSIQNARLLEAERNRRMEAEALYKTTTALTSSLDIDLVLDNILVELYRVVDYASANIQLLEDDIVRVVAAQGLLLAPNLVVGWEYPSSNELIVEMVETMQPVIVEDAIEDDRFSLPEALRYVRGWIGVPLVVGERMIGCMTIESDEVGAFNTNHAEKAKAFANQAAVAIESARLFSQTQRRLQVLQSIHTIDAAISRSLDLSVTFDVFLEQALNLLDVDAVRVFSYEQGAQMFEKVGERNLLAANLLSRDQLYDREMVEKALASRSVMVSNHLSDSERKVRREFACYSVAPLSTRGGIRGVVEVFHHNKFVPNEEWIDLLNTLATQAAIAIENNDLLTSLKRSNEELVIAYDRTLEGWAYALELRDRETVGHSRRVTDLTMRLARRIGISGPELANIRRGTLLHDIGKMGLPDSVLLKKGPLTSEEEKVMQTHPQLAYDMLLAIPYLKPALDIPYYHHEKWDGTGYPHGLKGEEIPLAARIFAVVDVWDAVVFDRPYREAWTRQEAIEYIRDQSGIHFDPQVVEVFLRIVEEEIQ